MSNDRDSNYISVGSWMFMMFITAIPVVGLIMIFVWALFGENESRKNYYRAILMWLVVAIGLVVALALLGNVPEIMKHFPQTTPKP